MDWDIILFILFLHLFDPFLIIDSPVVERKQFRPTDEMVLQAM